MINQAKEDGYEIKVTSGFRSYSTQKLILENSIKLGNKNARRLIAKPGYSEHQLGVAIDLTGASIKNVSATTKFKDSVEDKWLEENAKDYGFVESYPENKEDITGYMNEDWHYRYVGIDNAKEIINKKQTINEFLKEKLEEESLQNKITQTTE
jgi:D-alanyl-D-alanine carboxypeptidase